MANELPVIDQGTYEIVLAADTKMCLDVAGGSTASGANVQVWGRNGTDAQVYSTTIEDNTNYVTFTNIKSGKVLDLAGGKTDNGTNIQIWGPNNTAAQKWILTKVADAASSTLGYPTYVVRSSAASSRCFDCQGGNKTAKTNIRLWNRNNTIAQQFIFFPTERVSNDMEAPGAIMQKVFSRKGTGSVSVTGLTFNSRYTSFQARYLIRTYDKDTGESSDSSWKNTGTEATTNEGWGENWTPTFSIDSETDDPIILPFTKSISLNADNGPIKRELVIEIRPFGEVNGYKVHGMTQQSVIPVVLEPEFSVSGMRIHNDTVKKIVGIETTIANSLGQKCQRLRGRLLGSDGQPISEWVSTSNMFVRHMAGSSLRRLPTEQERITLEYSVITLDGLNVVSSYVHTFTYGSNVPTINPTVNILDDGSECVTVTSATHAYDYCMMVIPDIDGTKLVNAELVPTEGSTKQWKLAPPLNVPTEIIIMGSANGTSFGFASRTVTVNSHLFVWNWRAFGSNVPLGECAAIIVNTDNPPQQTRQFTTDIKFANPSGRIYPVGFATNMLSLDLSVEGVIIDPNASYQAFDDLPQHTSLEDMYKLIRLSGKGIHPVYRTPYGDWYTVGIESIDLSKLEMGKSSASIKQRAVED